MLTGAAVADVRLAALGPGGLPQLTGRAIDARAILLEPLQPRRDGSAVARVRLAGDVRLRGDAGRPAAVAGGLDGEVAVARAADGRRPAGVRVGSELRLRGTVAPLGDVDAYQRRRGAHAAIDVASWSATGRSRGGLAGRLDAVRERAADGLGRGLPPPEAALLRGMVLGQDEAIAEDVEADFRRSGLAHLLAVSGQNVLLLCMLVLAACAVLDVPLRARLIAAAVLVALYVPLAGGGPSIQRAGVMGIAGLVAALAGRPASRWYALGLAAAVTLVLNPRAAGEPGWQLSFAAVAGLLLLAPPLRALLARRGLPEPVADAAAITVAATVATAPLLAFHFEQVSLASLPANLLAAPVVAPVMWLGMLGMTAAQVAPAAALPFTVACAPLLGYLEWVAHAAAGAPLAALPVRLGGPLALALAYAALGGAVAGLARLASARGWDVPGPRPHGRRRMLAVAGAAALAVAVAALHARAARPAPPARGELVVSFMDVGQGDATLLQRDGAAVLVDTGPPHGPILRRLDEAGVGRLDLLVLTHAEADHEGMALPVIAAHRPRLVLDGGAGWPTAVQRGLAQAVDARRRTRRRRPRRPGPADRRAAPRRPLAAGAGAGLAARTATRTTARSSRTSPTARSTWCCPPTPSPRSSLRSTCRTPTRSRSRTTAAPTPGLPALLERLTPDVAAIEVGRENTYGHPAPSTLDALRAVPRLFRTDRDGTVRLRVRDGRMRLETAGA